MENADLFETITLPNWETQRIIRLTDDYDIPQELDGCMIYAIPKYPARIIKQSDETFKPFPVGGVSLNGTVKQPYRNHVCVLADDVSVIRLNDGRDILIPDDFFPVGDGPLLVSDINGEKYFLPLTSIDFIRFANHRQYKEITEKDEPHA